MKGEVDRRLKRRRGDRDRDRKTVTVGVFWSRIAKGGGEGSEDRRNGEILVDIKQTQAPTQ